MSEKMNGLKLSMGPATIEYAKPHVPSEIQADTLFTFMRQLDFLLPIIRNAMISPRYCEEDISYLSIDGFKRMAYPMKCFCDINMHRLETHLSWYGHYGIAFSKEWGMRNKIQAVQYINPESELCRDFSRTFSAALKIDAQKQSPSEQQMPIRDMKRIDSIDGAWDLTSEKDIRKSIGQPLFFEFTAVRSIELFGVELELPCLLRIFNAILAGLSEEGNTKKIILDDQSCDKPRYTSFLCFKDEAHMKKYEESTDRNISISQFHDARRAGEYLIVQEE